MTVKNITGSVNPTEMLSVKYSAEKIDAAKKRVAAAEKKPEKKAVL